MKRIMYVLLALMMVTGGLLVSCQKEAAPAAPAAAASSSADAPVAKKQVKVGITVPTADHGWTGGVVWSVEQAIKDIEGEDANVEFVLKTAADPAAMTAVVEDLMVQEIDALVILPHDASLTPVVKEAYDSGIFTVVIDRGLNEPAYDVYIAGDNPGLGRVSGEWIAEKLGGKGNVVELQGIPCPINTERVEAFKAVMDQYPGINFLESQPAYWSTQKGLEVMENYLQKYDKIDAVFAQDDDILKGVLQAYKESGRDDIKYFLGGAGSKDMIKMVMDGDPLVQADVTYHPSMAGSAVILGVMGARGENFKGFYQNALPSTIIIAAELITKENAADFYTPESVF
ncbi:MAG: substrate-binding domain-containing protein [Spirochaetales bacterium]|nr:substrate-binding domain-containing protein [Spirochaetales bacterium]